MVSPPGCPSYVVMALDATKEHGAHELKMIVDGITRRGDILSPGDTLIILGVLHRVPNPMGYQVIACPDSFAGASVRAIEEEVVKKVEVYVNMLLQSAETCQNQGVKIEVKITAGTPIKQVIFQEVLAMRPTWLLLDRYFRRDLKFYEKQIPCKVALIQDNFSLQNVKMNTTETAVIEHKLFYSMSKVVPLMHSESEPEGRSSISCGSYSLSSISVTSSRSQSLASSRSIKRSDRSMSRERSYAPILCEGCGARTEMYIKDTMRFSFADIQLATDNFAAENLLGEGGYGHVYKGELQDGQLIAAKVRKEASSQGFSEFHSEVYVLNFARHKNIVMLLGFCCKENNNILVYEYICNKSLEWHLFEKSEDPLEWHQRLAIAIGTAKGLRFLHEECRGGPIIHRDMRPSNILLTHDFVPMLGDFGLARWKTGGDDTMHTRILGTLGYLAPEYAEDGIVSVRADVYAFGITLLQLISGRKVIDSRRSDGLPIRQWAEPLVERLALHKLIDPRIADSYNPNELYIMAKTACQCVQRCPETRPSMGEVVRLLEGGKDSVLNSGVQLAPNIGD